MRDASQEQVSQGSGHSLAKDGSVKEEGSGMEVVDEVEDIPSGKSATLTVSLDPGNYVLLCNIVEEHEHESHYQMGMSTELVLE